jgi:hypothetical protein
LAFWKIEVGLYGWEIVVDSILASPEYNNRFGDDYVLGGCRPGCGPQMPSQSPSKMPSKEPSKILVEQFYCRVLQRLPESDQAIVGWIDYLQSHTVKDLVRFGILGDEFKVRFVDGRPDEILARTGRLYDVLLARAGDAGGLDYWGKEVGLFGWGNVVDRLLASDEYNNSFGDDAVPGAGREGCF